MWINDSVSLKREVEVYILTKEEKVLLEADLYLELKVVGELNYSINPEEYSFPDIEIDYLSLTVDSFHIQSSIVAITIEDFSTDIIIQTDSFDRLIEEYELDDFPTFKQSNILLSKDKLKVEYERKRA